MRRTAYVSREVRAHELRGRRTLEELLFQLSLCDLNLDSLVNLLLVPSAMVRVVLDCCGEEGVDECCLSQARLASDLIPESAVGLEPIVMILP